MRGAGILCYPLREDWEILGLPLYKVAVGVVYVGKTVYAR